MNVTAKGDSFPMGFHAYTSVVTIHSPMEISSPDSQTASRMRKYSIMPQHHIAS